MQLSIPARAALLAFLISAVPSAAQVVPSVDFIGGGCGMPTPQINTTTPLLTADLTVFVTAATPNTPITVFISDPPPGTPIVFGMCTAWIDPINAFILNGVTDARGVYTATFPTVSLVGYVPGAVCNLQAVLLTNAPGSLSFFGYLGFVSDAISITMGDVPKDPPSDVPTGSCCTFPRDAYSSCYSAGSSSCGSGNWGWSWSGGSGCGSGGWSWSPCGGSSGGSSWGSWGGSWGGSGGSSGCGSGGGSSTCPNALTILNANYSTLYPTGLVVGIYQTGCNTPNGKKFTSSTTGRNKLKDYLTGDSSSSGGDFDSDTSNNSESTGGGKLGRETAALTLNVKFSDANLVGVGCNFGDLIYADPSSSLNGASVRQILAVANQALAGNGLPAGYSFSQLKTLVKHLNEAFECCTASTWAKGFLYLPSPL